MILASALLAFSLFDFFPDAVRGAVPPPERFVVDSGQGELSVAFSQSSDGSIARGAVGIPVATLTLSASCDADVSIRTIRITHQGRGPVSDVTGVWLGDRARRLSRSARFDASTKTATLRLTRLHVPRCEAKVITLFMDLAPTATVGAEHAVTIGSARDIDSTASALSLTWEDTSEQVLITPYDAARLTISMLPVRMPLFYGRRMTVARLRITGDASRPLLLSRIVVTNMEDARDLDLQNFSLQTRSGDVLSGPALRMYGREVRLDIQPTFLVEKSQTIVLDLVADVRSGGYKKTDFIVQEPSDITVIPASSR